MKSFDWVDLGCPCSLPDEYRETTLSLLKVSFRSFINRALRSLCAGDPRSLIFDGVPLSFIDQAAGHMMHLRFANPELAAAAGEALAWGYWQHGCACLAIVRNGKAGWRVRLRSVA